MEPENKETRTAMSFLGPLYANPSYGCDLTIYITDPADGSIPVTCLRSNPTSFKY